MADSRKIQIDCVVTGDPFGKYLAVNSVGWNLSYFLRHCPSKVNYGKPIQFSGLSLFSSHHWRCALMSASSSLIGVMNIHYKHI
jgi:hypothetical protein